MSKAILRDPTVEDNVRARLWASDEELRRLAPVIRATSEYKDYAIEVAGNHIGYCSIYNVTADEAEAAVARITTSTRIEDAAGLALGEMFVRACRPGIGQEGHHHPG